MAVWTATPLDASAGAVLTAVQWDATVRDGFNAFGAWTSYTPTLTQSATVTKTVNYAKYFQVQKFVVAQISLACTSSGTVGQAILAGLPTAMASTSASCIGSFVVTVGGTVYSGFCQPSTTTAVGGVAHAQTNYIGTTPSLTLIAGSDVRFSVMYEAA